MRFSTERLKGSRKKTRYKESKESNEPLARIRLEPRHLPHNLYSLYKKSRFWKNGPGGYRL